MPIFRRARPYVTALVFSTRCAGWSLGKPGSRPCAHRAHGLLPGFPRLQPAHLLLKTNAVTYGLALLKMGIMMPETC